MLIVGQFSRIAVVQNDTRTVIHSPEYANKDGINKNVCVFIIFTSHTIQM